MPDDSSQSETPQSRNTRRSSGRFELFNAFVDSWQVRLKPLERAVWMTLFRFDGENGAYPGVAKLARLIGATDNATQRARAELVRHGLLREVQRGGCQGGRNMASVFECVIPNGASETIPPRHGVPPSRRVPLPPRQRVPRPRATAHDPPAPRWEQQNNRTEHGTEHHHQGDDGVALATEALRLAALAYAGRYARSVNRLRQRLIDDGSMPELAALIGAKLARPQNEARRLECFADISDAIANSANYAPRHPLAYLRHAIDRATGAQGASDAV